MNNKKHFNLGKKAIILGVLAVVILFVSSATAVPQVHGSITVEKLDEVERMETITNILSEQIDIENLDSEKTTIDSIFILATVTEQIISMVKNSERKLDASTILSSFEKIEIGEIDEKDIISKTQDCLGLLSITIDEMIVEKDRSKEEITVFTNLKTYLLKLQSLIDNDASNIDKYNEEENVGLLQRLVTIILLLLIIPFMILSGIISGLIGVLGGVVRGIFALVKLVILLFAGMQSALTLTAFFVILMGIMSKISINLFSRIGAPLLSIIISRMVPAIGKLLGGLSLAVHSLIALLIILAIPLSIVLIVVLLVVLLGDGGGITSILAPVLESLFGILITIPGLEDILLQVWTWLEDNLQDWPEWPFVAQNMLIKRSVIVDRI